MRKRSPDSLPLSQAKKHVNSGTLGNRVVSRIITTLMLGGISAIAFYSEVIDLSALTRAINSDSDSQKINVSHNKPFSETLLEKISESRKLLEEKMKEDFGDYYYHIIFEKNISSFFMNDISKERLVRRMMKKILMAQQQQEHGVNNTTTFTWTTGGHSASAGHGNLFNQSYTKTMENTAKDVFASVGINFIGKNYAMGGMGSGPELSLCMESIYGSDIDVLSWDFGMTDGRDLWKLTLWGHRAAVHPTRPILVLRGDGHGRYETLQRMETIGMGVLSMNYPNINDVLKEELPDSNLDAVQVNVTAALRNFACGGSFESDGICKAEKFKTGCETAKYQTSWHPGWKAHHLEGSIMGFFMVSTLQEAIEELHLLQNPYNSTSSELYDLDSAKSILDFLKRKDDTDLAAAKNSSVPINSGFPADILDKEDVTTILSKNNVCHSALLPSQARYDGIVTGTGNKVGYNQMGYDLGLSMSEVNTLSGKTIQSLPLVYDPDQRQQCEMQLEIDYKDRFYVMGNAGWFQTTLPNNAEVEAFRQTKKKSEPTEGLLMMCMVACDWGRCATGYTNPDDDLNMNGTGTLFIEVDGKPVIGTKKIGTCHFLEGKDGLKWGPGVDGRGQYELKIKLEKENSFMQISSLIVW